MTKDELKEAVSTINGFCAFYRYILCKKHGLDPKAPVLGNARIDDEGRWAASFLNVDEENVDKWYEEYENQGYNHSND